MKCFYDEKPLRLVMVYGSKLQSAYSWWFTRLNGSIVRCLTQRGMCKQYLNVCPYERHTAFVVGEVKLLLVYLSGRWLKCSIFVNYCMVLLNLMLPNSMVKSDINWLLVFFITIIFIIIFPSIVIIIISIMLIVYSTHRE